MMKSFINHGHHVIAVGSEDEIFWKPRFDDFNIEYHQINVERNGLNVFKDLSLLFEIKNLLQKIDPDKIFAYQAKTVIYGSIAARINSIYEFYPMMAGLGSVFRGNGLKNTFLKQIMKAQYRLAFLLSKKIIFQNSDDMKLCLDLKLLPSKKAFKVNGSGVNLNLFQPHDLPNEFAFLFIGRLIKDKGIIEYLEASKTLKEKYPKCRFMLVGPFDSNPSALKAEELNPYIEKDIIEYFGEQSDVKPYLNQCSVFVLPSYHEGTPKTVLEAMATARAIITSNAPGCRETVLNHENGLLVEVESTFDLVQKMEMMILNPDSILQMGLRSLELVREKFDVQDVNKSILNIMDI